MHLSIRHSWALACRLLPIMWFATVAASTQESRRAVPPRPNIVLIVADDLGYGELGCQGNPQIPTPHIDSLARDGVRFTQGYVTAAYCSASRAGLLTGRFQTRFGYEFNPIGANNEDPEAGIPGSERTLAEALQDAGYATGLIGKWHLGGHARFHPFRHGFDEFFGFTHEGHFFVPPPYRGVTTMLRRRTLPTEGSGRWIRDDQRWVISTHMGSNEPDYDANNPIVRASQPFDEPAYLTDAWSREAVDFIDRHEDRPFFLYIAHNAVHSPLQATDAMMRRFQHIDDIHRRIFAGMLSHMDDSVGAVLNKLRSSGLDRRTLVIFLSDNGGPTRELTSSNAPLRGGKGTVYEGGLRVPFLMRWTGVLPSSAIYDAPVCSVDIFPTVCQLAGADVPEDRIIDGVDLIPHLLEPEDHGDRPHESLFWRLGSRTAIRSGDWKLLRNGRRGQSAEWELYHLATDISESHDLAASYPDRLQRLKVEWEQWNEQMQAPFWQPR